MLEDDEKVRRNLMVVSFAVVVYFWLNLPDALVLKRILGSEMVPTVDGWKIWTLILVVTLYQFHRYWSVLMGTETWAQVQGQVSSRRYGLMVRLSHFNVRLLPTKRRLLFARLKKPEKLGGEPLEYVRSPEERAMAQDLHYPVKSYPYLMEVKLVVEDKEGRMASGGRSIWVEIPKHLQWPAVGLCALSLINTRHFSEVGIPLLAGLTSIILVLCKLVELVIT